MPERVAPEKRSEIARLLLRRPAEPSPDFAGYRRRWLGAILARYRGSRTRIIFVRLARGPVVRPGLSSDPASSIREFAARGDAVLIDEHRFDILERPELFLDALHMNQQGAVQFSTMLASEVAGILSGAAR